MVEGLLYIQRLQRESHNIEPVTPADEPESCTLIPAYLTLGVAVFKFTMFVPIETDDAEIY
jgi:hypothetical protein